MEEAEAQEKTGERPEKTANSLVVSGFLLLVILMIIPVWESASLLEDFNYTYWAGHWEPLTIILLCGVVLVGYVASAAIYTLVDPKWIKHDSSTAFFVHMFVSMVALVYLFGALGLMKQANEVSMNLMDHCAHSHLSYNTFLYSQVLHRMRRRPGCDDKMSVEECEGFTPVQPYLDFLKQAEETFRCSGFCFEAPNKGELKVIEKELDLEDAPSMSRVVSRWPWPTPKPEERALAPAPSMHHIPYLAQAPSPVDLAAAPSPRPNLVEEGAAFLHKDGAAPTIEVEGASPPAPAPRSREHHQLLQLADLAAAGGEVHASQMRAHLKALDTASKPEEEKIVWNYTYAPTLFSRANFPLSCHGMAARDLIDHAGAYGELLCFQGLCLISGASFAYVLKVIRHCIRKEF